MTPERWQRIKEVFDASLELQPRERGAWLARVCGPDAELRREVESLIASHESADDALDTPALATAAAQVAAALDDFMIGRRIGAYEIVEEIGRGGMGAVYRAERVDRQFRMQVAIKLVKRGLNDDFVLRRFRHERQIMASLDHPNIGRLLDGGITDDGLPYFVMELIDGRPIDEYCDAERLTTVERLRLFRTVCSAVEYAHRNGVVHRDIKPANILITPDGTPKLLDFGIAKIINPLMATTVDLTGTVVRLMTPEYASPEQVRGEAITDATDVYSLGVLLYELLSGHRPYRFRSRAPHELAQAICETDPERPSTAVRRVEQITRPGADEPIIVNPERVGQARRCHPDRLRRALTGDLDNIILTALRKDPARRYRSVEAFSEDIRRHLEGLPVLARRDKLLYRTRKLIERNRAAAITAGISLVIVLAVLALFHYSGSNELSQAPAIAPFTSFPGDETQPSFSPDGRQIAFVWGGDNNDNQDIYVRPLDGSGVQRITTDRAQDLGPCWSPDGKAIAFLRIKNDPVRVETALFVAPLPRGVHRKVADVYPSRVEAAGIEAVGRPVVWSPDGRYLAIGDRVAPAEPFAIYLIDVKSGARRRITLPPDRSIGDTAPAFSPDGRRISFIRAPSSGVTDLYVIPATGGMPQRLTNDHRDILGQTWTHDGRGIVFSSNRTGSYNLWRIPASGGTPQRMAGIPPGASDPSFSPDGHLLAYAQFSMDTNVWRIDAEGLRRPRKLLVSTQYDSSPQYSPDGTRIAFRSSRSGSHEIWLSDSEGLRATQLTNFGGPLTGTPRWSPDGRWVVFDSRPDGQAEIYVVSASGGEPRAVTHDPAEDVVPSWSRDGRWIYFASNRSGAWQVWRTPPEGGQAEQMTRMGGFAAFESPDGRYLYYAKGRSVGELWRLPLGRPGAEERVLANLKPGFWGYWAVQPRGVYYVDELPEPASWAIFFHDFATHHERRIAALERRPMIGDSAFAVSPDGRYLLYTQVDQSGSDIMLADYAAR